MRRAVAEHRLLEYWGLLQEHHRLLTEAADQPLASSLIGRLQGPVVRHRFQLLLRPGRAQESLAELTEVVEAVADRRADSAESAARANLQGVIDGLLDSPES
jgi:DNA-binding GntR family transcriptional regulator